MYVRFEISNEPFFDLPPSSGPRHGSGRKFNRRDRRAAIAVKHAFVNDGLHTLH